MNFIYGWFPAEEMLLRVSVDLFGVTDMLLRLITVDLWCHVYILGPFERGDCIVLCMYPSRSEACVGEIHGCVLNHRLRSG